MLRLIFNSSTSPAELLLPLSEKLIVRASSFKSFGVETSLDGIIRYEVVRLRLIEELDGGIGGVSSIIVLQLQECAIDFS